MDNNSKQITKIQIIIAMEDKNQIMIMIIIMVTMMIIIIIITLITMMKEGQMI